MYGKGLNSLRIRFTLMMATVTMLMVVVATAVELSHDPGLTQRLALGFLGLLAVAATGLTYFMTGKLTRPIENLRASTEAIARGDFNTAVNVECSCEVGGLADSFRMMVQRLNSNVTRINTLAFEDGITGLPNRTVLNDVLKNIADMQGALLFIDLDNFKQVNDTLGHERGDQLLLQVADRLVGEGLEMTASSAGDCLSPLGEMRANSQACRMLFRWAGDEFIALVGGATDKQDIARIAEQMIASTERPFMLGEHMVRISASIGIALLHEDSGNAAEIIKFADIAMYEAKNAGRARISFFNDQMRERAMERAELEADLETAIENRELRVHYQPKIAIGDLSMEGVEALVRWQHPRRGLLYPSAFIAIAEACGLVGKIGAEVLRIVAEDQKIWRRMNIRRRVSVNVCPSQFSDPDFSGNVLSYLAQLQLPADLIELELTETIATADPGRTTVQLNALKDAGVRIAIDDFGVGYSNLSHLYSLPFDVLKLDRSLICDLSVNLSAQTIVAAAITMAHGLGHQVVAEGVETVEQFAILKAMQCDCAQGFLFSRPVDAAELEDVSPTHILSRQQAA